MESLKAQALVYIKNFNIMPSYWQAIAFVVLFFVLILTLAQVRHHFVSWSLKGALTGIFLGFLLALIIEGFLIIGGKTALTEVLGWKSAPKPIQTAVDLGREKLVNVLGVKDQIPTSNASEIMTSSDAIKALQSLDPTEIKKIKAIICTP